MTHYPRLTSSQLTIAVKLWGWRWGTWQIPEHLGLDEAAVANSLSHWREAQRSIEERRSRDDESASREVLA